MEPDMTAVELSQFLEEVVPPFERFAHLVGKDVRFKNNHTIRNYGNQWLKGRLDRLMSQTAIIDNVPFNYDGMEIERPFGG